MLNFKTCFKIAKKCVLFFIYGYYCPELIDRTSFLMQIKAIKIKMTDQSDFQMGPFLGATVTQVTEIVDVSGVNVLKVTMAYKKGKTFSSTQNSGRKPL